MSDKAYSVWVGGGEINSHYLTIKEAKTLAQLWRNKGYDDVQVRKEP